MIDRRLLPAVIALALAGCGPMSPLSSREPGASSAMPVASESIESVRIPIALPVPGRPYDSEDLLGAMRDSRRPGGVPAELQDERIAAEMARLLFTFDGEPWDAIVAGGSCGPSACTLELSGGRADQAGEDAWVFSVDPVGGVMQVVSADLHAMPNATAAALDRWARLLDETGMLEGLDYTAVRWLPPPAEGRFLLSYRSGDEEESCSIDLELDAGAGRIGEATASGC